MQLSGLGLDFVHYPLKMLQEHREHLTYYKTDTHWNKVGAALLMNQIASHAGLTQQDFGACYYEINGDLGIKLGGEFACEVAPSLKIGQPGKLLFHNGVRYRGAVRVAGTLNPDLPIGVTFCDSFFNTVIDLISSYFNKLYMFCAPLHDYGIIESLKPDVVITEMAERFVQGEPNQASFKQDAYNKLLGLNYPLHELSLREESFSKLDYALVRSYAHVCERANQDEDGIAARIEFLLENIPGHVWDSKRIDHSNFFWESTEDAKFSRWAVGFTLAETSVLAGICFFLSNISRNEWLSLTIYSVHCNFSSPRFEDRKPIYTRRYRIGELNCYADDQEVFFPLWKLSLPGDAAYLAVLECSDTVGMGMGGCMVSGIMSFCAAFMPSRESKAGGH